MLSHNQFIRYLFYLCCFVFSAIWIAIFVNYQLNRYQSDLYIVQTINGKVVITIRGEASESVDIIRSLLTQNNGSDVNAEWNSLTAKSNPAHDMDRRSIGIGAVETTSGYDVTTGNDVMESKFKPINHNISDRLNFSNEYECPINMTFNNISDIHLCGDIQDKKYKLIFFTTMYYTHTSLNFFYNSLRVIASMQRDFDVKPVLFVENTRAFAIANQTNFLQFACNLGWTIILAPHCNKYGFPVFKSMFNVSMETWDADWYGYSNGDMLFDGTLISTLDFIQSHSDILKIPMLMGRRYIIPIDTKTRFSHYSQIRKLHFRTQLDSASAVDYFMTRKGDFPWHEVPDFVVGRPVYDTWMVWFSQVAKLPLVDTTATVRAIHQHQRGLNHTENTHKIRRQDDGMKYNKELADDIAARNESMKLKLYLGYLSCVPLKLIKMKRDVLNDMVASGKTEIVGRGKDHHPIEADDEEYLSAVKLFNQSYTEENNVVNYRSFTYKNGDIIKEKENSYELNGSKSTSRRLLAKRRVKKKAPPINSTQVEDKRSNNEPLQNDTGVAGLKESQKEKGSYEKHGNDTEQKSGSEQARGSKANDAGLPDTGSNDVVTYKPDVNVTTKSTTASPPFISTTPAATNSNMNRIKMTALTNSTSIPQAVILKGIDNTTYEKNNTVVDFKSNMTNSVVNSKEVVSNVTVVKRRVRKETREEWIKRRNEEQKLKTPEIHPLIHESPDYVFVLVRRTKYLEWRKRFPGFRKVDIMEKCQEKQNIDMELSEFVTF